MRVRLMMGLVAWLASGHLLAEGLPAYGDRSLAPEWAVDEVRHRVAEFDLVDQAGQPATLDQSQGRIRVVNFFFATCPGICPVTMFNLKRVQDAVDGQTAQLLSFSITPRIDTPDTLAAYGHAMGIDEDRWRLLTGDEAQVTALAEDSFFSVLERNVATGQLAHTERAYLVDGEGRIRGVYNATSPADIMRLLEDLERLL